MTRQSNVSVMHKDAGWQTGQDTGWAMLSPSWAVVKQGRSSLNRDVKDRNNLEFSFVFCCLATQSCPTLCNTIGCSLPDSPVHGIFQARILEQVAVSFSRSFVFCISSIDLKTFKNIILCLKKFLNIGIRPQEDFKCPYQSSDIFSSREEEEIMLELIYRSDYFFNPQKGMLIKMYLIHMSFHMNNEHINK